MIKTHHLRLCVVLVMMLGVGQGLAAAPLQPLTIQLNWIPNVEFAGILLAKERGWYAEQGIDLTINGWKPGVKIMDAIDSGQAQIGVIEGGDAIKHRAAGKAIKAIAAQFQKSPYCLISKKSAGIATPKDLVGKKVGFNNNSATLLLNIMLANQGMKATDVQPVKIGRDLQPLINDEVDASPGFMNDEVLTMKSKGYDVAYLPGFQYGYDFYSEVYIVTDRVLQEQPELIEKFLSVTLRGWQAAFQDPAATAALIVEKYYPDGSVAQQTESLKLFHMLATLSEGKKFLGWMDERFWQKGINLLFDFKQIDAKVSANDVFTMEFLEKAYFTKK